MFRALPSAYHTPMPAFAFSHPLCIADPSVLIVACRPLGSIPWFILAGALSLMIAVGFFVLEGCKDFLGSTAVGTE